MIWLKTIGLEYQIKREDAAEICLCLRPPELLRDMDDKRGHRDRGTDYRACIRTQFDIEMKRQSDKTWKPWKSITYGLLRHVCNVWSLQMLTQCDADQNGKEYNFIGHDGRLLHSSEIKCVRCRAYSWGFWVETKFQFSCYFRWKFVWVFDSGFANGCWWKFSLLEANHDGLTGRNPF